MLVGVPCRISRTCSDRCRSKPTQATTLSKSQPGRGSRGFRTVTPPLVVCSDACFVVQMYRLSLSCRALRGRVSCTSEPEDLSRQSRRERLLSLASALFLQRSGLMFLEGCIVLLASQQTSVRKDCIARQQSGLLKPDVKPVEDCFPCVQVQGSCRRLRTRRICRACPAAQAGVHLAGKVCLRSCYCWM